MVIASRCTWLAMTVFVFAAFRFIGLIYQTGRGVKPLKTEIFVLLYKVFDRS